MLTQTLQGALQAEIRSATGKTNQDFNGDLHDLCTIYGVPMAPVSGRIIPVAQIFDSSINSSASALNYLLKNATTVVGPRGLFAAGEQGAWYDPSDLTTLYQDSAGTTPVTAVEQPVGLVLDKSKGLVLGSELFSTFGTATSPWTAQGGGVWSIDGSQAGSRDLAQNTQYTVNRFYVTRFTLSGVTGGTVTVFAGEGSVGPTYGNGTFTIRSYSSQAYLIFRAPAGVAATVSNVSVRELPGNHAYQTTSASRPTLRARYNLLTYSEQFDNAAWVKTGFNAFGAGSVANTTATLDPLGGNTADYIQENAITTEHYVFPSGGIAVGAGSYRGSVYAKAAERSRLVMGIWNGTNYELCQFDLANGVVLQEATPGIASIQSAGNDWWRCGVSRTIGTTTVYLSLGPNTNTNIGTLTGAWSNAAYTGNGTSGIYIWGAQLVSTAVFPSNTYQRIAAATDYATGAAFPPYLFFDGVDDSLLTNSVDFSATDKMTVWAGVTKNSNAAQGGLVQLGIDPFSVNGSFGVFVPSGAGASDYYLRTRGTLVSNAATPSSYVPPITNVVTSQIDIAGDAAVVRVNAVQAASSASDQGTGNFGNYPIYVASRAGAQFFNGNIYSLIIRGAQSTAAQISTTESWVAAKTPLGSL